jgi:DNA polymerase III epsilon subunit-like protein
MYQKLFESWRNYTNVLKEYEVEKSESEMYGKSFQDFLDNLPTDEEISQFESELSSEVQEKKSEMSPEAEAQPIDKVSSPQAAKRYSDKTWIFFDTETTSLEVGAHDQITQIAALAMDPKGFREGVEAQEVGRFNKKLNLAYGTLDRLAYEKEDEPFRAQRNLRKIQRRRSEYQEVAPGVVKGKPVSPYELERPVIKNFQMTGYGVSPDEMKRKRKAYAHYAETETSAGRTPMSIEDFPTPPGPEMIQHGPSVMKDFLEFIDQYPNRILVAQNAGFDVKQVNFLLQRVGLPVPQEKVFDTITFFRKYLVPIMKSLNAKKMSGEQLSEADIRFLKDLTKDGKQTVSLGYLVKAFKLENKGWHDAFADVQMLHDAMKACIVFLQSRSEFTDLLSQQPEKKTRTYTRKDSSQQQLPGVKPSDID